jgi:hypothetical protein
MRESRCCELFSFTRIPAKCLRGEPEGQRRAKKKEMFFAWPYEPVLLVCIHLLFSGPLALWFFV